MLVRGATYRRSANRVADGRTNRWELGTTNPTSWFGHICFDFNVPRHSIDHKNTSYKLFHHACQVHFPMTRLWFTDMGHEIIICFIQSRHSKLPNRLTGCCLTAPPINRCNLAVSLKMPVYHLSRCIVNEIRHLFHLCRHLIIYLEMYW